MNERTPLALPAGEKRYTKLEGSKRGHLTEAAAEAAMERCFHRFKDADEGDVWFDSYYGRWHWAVWRYADVLPVA